MLVHILQYIGLHLLSSFLIIPLIFMLYFFDPNKKILPIMILTLTSLIITHQWKELFHIPLPTHHPSTAFAFPSGHLQLITVFYGALFFEFFGTIKCKSFALLVVLSSWATISAGYHNPIDILGGIAFGLIHLAFFYRCLYVFGIQRIVLAGLTTSVLIISIQKEFHLYLWESFGLLCTFSVLTIQKIIRTPTDHRFPSLVLSLLFLGTILQLIPIHSHDLPSFSYAIYTGIASWITLSTVPKIYTSLTRKTHHG